MATALGLLVLFATPVVGAWIFLGIRILDARDDATSALSRNGTTQADPSRNLETTRLTSSGGREPATGTTRPKFIDPWLDHHGGPRKLPPESGLGLVSIGHTACSGECFLGCVRVLR